MNDEDIKRIAEEMRKQNGNARITNKDLLFYIIHRLDKLEDENQEQDKIIQRNKTCISVFFILFPIAITVATYIGSILQ